MFSALRRPNGDIAPPRSCTLPHRSAPSRTCRRYRSRSILSESLRIARKGLARKDSLMKLKQKPEAAPNTSLLHSIPDAGKLLGDTSRTGIYRLLGQGRLVGVKVGSRTKITDPSLRAWYRLPCRP